MLRHVARSAVLRTWSASRCSAPSSARCAPLIHAQRFMSAQPREAPGGDRPAARRVTYPVLKRMYKEGTPIAVLTAYDASLARLVNDAVDVILIGDSVGMVSLGYESTTTVTLDQVISCCAAVARGAPRPFLVGDLPFGSYITVDAALKSSVRMVQEGHVHAVKLEGGRAQAAKIAAIAAEGIPTVAHIGLTPQTTPLSVGYTLQAKTAVDATRLVEDALAVEKAGAVAVVLEKIPAQVAAYITSLVRIPTIGIGAGPHCSGQVLVAHDMLGLYHGKIPRFAKVYVRAGDVIQKAVREYADDVRQRRFPPEPQNNNELLQPLHHFNMAPSELSDFAVAMERQHHNEHGLRTLRKELTALESLSASRPAKETQRPVFMDGSTAVPRIAVIGAGAVGSMYAAMLRRISADVTLFGVRRDGQRNVTLAPGQEPVTVSVHRLPGNSRENERPDRQFDATFVACRAQDVPLVAEPALGITSPSGYVIPIMNGGYSFGYLRRAQNKYAQEHPGSPDMVYGCTYAAAHQNGIDVALTGTGATILAPLGSHRNTGKLASVAECVTSAGLVTTVLPPGSGHALRWSKVAVNAIINPLAALLGTTNGELVRILHQHHHLFDEAIAEVAAIMHAHVPDTDLRHIPGWHAVVDMRGMLQEHVLRVCRATSANTSSMLAAWRAGAPSESAFILGWLLRQADTAPGGAMHVPRLRAVYAAVSSSEAAIGLPPPPTWLLDVEAFDDLRS